MKEQLRESFGKQKELFTFTRAEFLEYLNVKDQEDDIDVINSILKSKEFRASSKPTAIFLDETSVSRANKSFDWSRLENTNHNLSLIISFQPMMEANKF